jgi:hypothetical protein
MPRKFDLSSRATGDGRRATGCEKRVKIDWCSSGFLVILFITEGAEHTDKIHVLFAFFLCVARSASVCSVVQNGFVGGALCRVFY